MQKGVWQSMLLHWRDPDLDRSFTCISLLISRCLVHEALRHVSWSVLSESQEGGGEAYLRLVAAERPPLVSNESALLFEDDTLEIGALDTLAEEESPGRARTLHAALIFDVLGLARCHRNLAGAAQGTFLNKPPLQPRARVVGKTDLVGCVRFDPGLVLSSAGFGALSSYVVVFL